MSSLKLLLVLNDFFCSVEALANQPRIQFSARRGVTRQSCANLATNGVNISSGILRKSTKYGFEDMLALMGSALL